MGEVIPLARKEGQACTEMVHHFLSIPGRCQCGEHIWTEAPTHDDPGILMTEAGWSVTRGESNSTGRVTQNPGGV